jgi:hypothetical protein
MVVFWPMIGKRRQVQGKLFYTHLNIEKRAGENHPLHNIDEFIDYAFSDGEVKKKDGSKGNVSVSPPVILNLIVLLLFYNMK